MSTVSVNGKTYQGNNVTVINNEVFIDGKKADSVESKEINITISGNIQTLEVDSCNKLEITGECGNVNSKNGNIHIKGNVSGDVVNKNGNISCGNVGGNVDTKNGNISNY